MRIRFIYTHYTGAMITEELCAGLRLSPTDEQPSGTGAAQESSPPRATGPTFYGRGLASWTESFTGWKEHSDYWTGKMWARKSVQAMLGRKGTLRYEHDRGGAMQLVGCVLVSAQAVSIGIVTSHRYVFRGGLWS